MKLIKDTNNLYLNKFFEKPVIDKLDSLWLFYNNEEIPKIKLQKDEQLFCGKFAFELHDRLPAFNDWNRSGITKDLKPHIVKQIDIIATDQRKIYYDFLNLDANFVYNFPISFVTKKRYIDWITPDFITQNPQTRHISYLLKILGKLELIILNGYHHSGENLILFISKKGKTFFNKDQIEIDNDFHFIFENTVVYNGFHL